nr:dephospho-CoA kinase [Pleionea sp. CnH1-48]
MTGGIGSGKTAVSDLFQSLGITIVDADLVSREVVASGTDALKKIAQRFGSHILDDDGQLNRSELRQHVFNSEDDLNWLNALLHPLIRERMDALCNQATSDYVIIVVPLLIENGLDKTVDRVLVVDVPESLQVQRVMQRDNVDESNAKAILSKQASRSERLAKADDVIENNASFEALEVQVKQQHQFYLSLAHD